VPLRCPHATVRIQGTLRGIEASSVTRRTGRVRRLKRELDQRGAPEPVHNGLKPTPHVRNFALGCLVNQISGSQHGSQAGRAWNPRNIASWRTIATPRCEEHRPRPDVRGTASSRCKPKRCMASMPRASPVRRRPVSTCPRHQYARTGQSDRMCPSRSPECARTKSCMSRTTPSDSCPCHDACSVRRVTITHGGLHDEFVLEDRPAGDVREDQGSGDREASRKVARQPYRLDGQIGPSSLSASGFTRVTFPALVASTAVRQRDH
jgi:hypothetical protein